MAPISPMTAFNELGNELGRGLAHLGISALGAAPQEHPLIDLDSTVFLQLVVFLVTAVLLTQLLFKPYLKVRDARFEGMKGAREAAARMTEEAGAAVADYEAVMAKAKVKAGEERVKVRGETLAAERDINQGARAVADKLLDDARGALASELEQARADVKPRAAEMGTVIAKKLLGREVHS